MVRLLVLGSSCLITTESHRPAHFACIGRNHGLLIDCGVSPRARLEELGVGRDGIDDVLITHFHPDHVAGLPPYILELWLRGRTKPLHVHAGKVCLGRIQQVLDLYEWRQAPDLFPVHFHEIPEGRGAAALENENYRVRTTPVRHMVPTLAVRVEDVQSAGSAVFSSDTEPTAELEDLARGADLLLHEATGAGIGHSGAAQAGDVARRAGVRRLILVHYDPYAVPEELLSEARSVFPGEVELAADRMEITLG
jgi:ribonuclease Z